MEKWVDNNWIKVKVYEKLCLVINEVRMPYTPSDCTPSDILYKAFGGKF